MLQVFYAWCAARIKPVPTMLEDIQAEADRLYRDTINRQLQLIDDKYKVAANQAKTNFLFDQMELGARGLPKLPEDLT